MDLDPQIARVAVLRAESRTADEALRAAEERARDAKEKFKDAEAELYVEIDRRIKHLDPDGA